VKGNRAGKIRTVILDLGNVLVFHDNARLARNLAEAVGVSPVEVERWAVTHQDAINRGALDGEAIYRSFLRHLQKIGVKDGALSMERFRFLWSSHFTPHDAVFPMVEALASQVKLALLSNTNALHVEYLRPRVPVLARFDALLFSNEQRCAKPDPAFFLKALERTGGTPDATLFFDDLSEYTQAAEALGIHAYLFTTAEHFRADLFRWGLTTSS
jgi:HAD superfamily hydrolase (TIGR01509 family)